MIQQSRFVEITPTEVPSASVQQWIVLACGETISPSLPDSLQPVVENAFANRFAKGKAEETVSIVHEESLIVVAGMGERESIASIRSWGEAVHQALSASPIQRDKPVAILVPDDEPSVVRSIVDGCVLGQYQWKKYLSSSTTDDVLRIELITRHRGVVDQAHTIAHGVNFARDCANENADVAIGDVLADTILKLTENDPRCEVVSFGRAELEQHGLHLHLAVNQGSDKEPRLVIVRYSGGAASDPYTALVGKGITYDTGGLNLKPTGGIESMRMDMSGSAAIMGTLSNVLALQPDCNLLFVCGFAENAIGPRAYKPGDVIPSYAGLSVEILNTDAEGRLVLADACAYVVRNYQPQSLVTIATLTGAVVMALGYEHTGLMATDDNLADDLLQSASESDDWAWRLPIYPQLQSHVKSQIADIKNTGIARAAGTISAGEFIRQFAQKFDPDLKWAHLDIAGTAKPKEPVSYFASGATGAGVRLLTEFCLRKS